MKLYSTRGWEELDWEFEQEFEENGQTYYNSTLKIKTTFWNRHQLIKHNVSDQSDDSNLVFQQLIIDKRRFLDFLEFIKTIVNSDINNLALGKEMKFKLIDRKGEQLILSFNDSNEISKYQMMLSLIRGKTSTSFEMITDITCLDNFYKSIEK